MAFSEQQHYGWGPGEAIHQVDADYRSSPLVTNQLSALKPPSQVRDRCACSYGTSPELKKLN